MKPEEDAGLAGLLDRPHKMVTSMGRCSTRHFWTAGRGCAGFHLVLAPKNRSHPTSTALHDAFGCAGLPAALCELAWRSEDADKGEAIALDGTGLRAQWMMEPTQKPN